MKWLALLAASPTVAFLSLFAIGEVAAGDLSGLQHVLQMAPLVVALDAAWRFPRVGGAALVAVSVAVGIALAVFADARHFSVETAVLVESLFALPALVSGLLFMTAARPGA